MLRSWFSQIEVFRSRACVLMTVLLLTLLIPLAVPVGTFAQTVDPNATYKIVNRNSGKVLDVNARSTADGANVHQWTDNGGTNQQWRFQDAGGGFFRVVAQHSGKCLDVAGASTADGANVQQWACGAGTNQQWSVTALSGGFVRLTPRHSGKALDVQNCGTADGTNVRQWAWLNNNCQQWSLVRVGGSQPTPTPPPSTGGLVGFATVSGMGRSTTTGGAGGSTVTVSNATQFLEAIARSGPLIIRVNGTISISGMQRVTSDKTIIGVGTAGRITGGGLTMRTVQNIIIRNITFTNADDDSINIEESSHHIWIDHNDFSNGVDGAVDIKRGSDFITVSWNHFHDHDKTMLLGHSDDNASQDVGHLRVTYHHNFFNGTNQRHPRVRFGNPVHVYNNYYFNIGDYGVASTENAGVLVEGNYFENVEDPYHLGEGSSDPGSLVARNNFFVNSGSGQTGGSVAAIPYSYSLDSASSVKSIVMSGAGVGRVSG